MKMRLMRAKITTLSTAKKVGREGALVSAGWIHHISFKME